MNQRIPAHSRRSSWRRPAVAVVGMLSAALVLAGCAGGGSASDGSTQAGWEPVTTTGAFGDPTIEEKPEKVFALSTTDADMLLAVGVTPLAVPSMPQTDAATDGTSIYPWQEGLYPKDTPKVEASATELDIEAIAETDPDLIVGTAFFGLTEANYKQLSEIAPVVHYEETPNADAWQDSTRKVATAVGEPEAGDAAIEGAEGTLDSIRQQYPDLEGTSFNAVITPSPDSVWILCSEEDNLARVLSDFGMKLSDFAKSVDCDGGKAELSWEKVPELDADVLWAIPDTPDQMEELTKQDLWNRLPAVTRGAVVDVPKTDGVPFALGFPSPLSLVWAADQLAPRLSEAATQ